MSTKGSILSSVLKLVNREGFYHLNMKNIAKEAGVATGTIYLYFNGKEILINELYKMIVQELNRTILNGYDEGHSIKENFFSMLGNAYDYFMNEPDRFSFVEQYTFSPFLFKETKEENFGILKSISAILKQAKDQQVFKDLPDNILISLFYGPVISIVRLSVRQRATEPDPQQRELLLQACWESILSEQEILKPQHV